MSGMLSIKITRTSIGQATSFLGKLDRNPQCVREMSNWSSKKSLLCLSPKQALPWIGFSAIGPLALYTFKGTGSLALTYKDIKTLSNEKFKKMRNELSRFTNFFASCEKCEEMRSVQSLCMTSMNKEDELIVKANAELEKVLMEIKKKAMCSSQLALAMVCDVVDVVKIFMEAVNCAAEEYELKSPEFEAAWCTVQEYCGKRCLLYQKSGPKVQEAWENLCQLRDVVERGKNCKYTCSNPLLKIAEESLCCAEYELTSGKVHMECVMQESRLMEQYRNLLEGFRRDLKAEKESLIGICDCPKTLSENELMMVLTHAFKKLIRIQAELNSAGSNSRSDPGLMGDCSIEQLRIRAAINGQTDLDAEDSKCTCNPFNKTNGSCNKNGCQEDDFVQQDCYNNGGKNFNEQKPPQCNGNVSLQQDCSSEKIWFSSVFSSGQAPENVQDCGCQQPAAQVNCNSPPKDDCAKVKKTDDYNCTQVQAIQQDCGVSLDNACKANNECGKADDLTSNLCEAQRCPGCSVCEINCECFNTPKQP